MFADLTGAGLALAASVVFTAEPLADVNVLEPSVRNEVDRALDLAPTSTVASTVGVASLFPTNGLSATELAVGLVSRQRADGRWLAGTNDVTAAAVELLRGL